MSAVDRPDSSTTFFVAEIAPVPPPQKQSSRSKRRETQRVGELQVMVENANKVKLSPRDSAIIQREKVRHHIRPSYRAEAGCMECTVELTPSLDVQVAAQKEEKHQQKKLAQQSELAMLRTRVASTPQQPVVSPEPTPSIVVDSPWLTVAVQG